MSYFNKTMVVCCFFIASCASFKNRLLPEVDQLHPLPTLGQKQDVTYSFSAYVDFGRKREEIEWIRSSREAEFTEVLRESGYFATITQDTQRKDISLKVDLLRSSPPLTQLSVGLSGTTFLIFPGFATEKYDVSVKVTTRDDQEYLYNLTDSQTTVFWLPMVVILPFNDPVTVPADVRKNIYRNLVLQMQKDGILPKP